MFIDAQGLDAARAMQVPRRCHSAEACRPMSGCGICMFGGLQMRRARDRKFFCRMVKDFRHTQGVSLLYYLYWLDILQVSATVAVLQCG